MIETATHTFGPSVYGSKLLINKPYMFELAKPLIIDVETDEKDNFVGIALTQDGKIVHYYSELRDDIKVALESYWTVGHNIKFDIKQLIGWGLNIKSNQMFYDTCLASYVQNTTKESHGLKDLAKEYLNMEWPTYKDMVGSGKKKVTLDKQEVGRVAAYCGTDCLATYRLYEYFQKKLTTAQKHYLETIEMPTARVLLEIELKGVQIDVEYLKELDKKFSMQLEEIKALIPVENINSNRQIASLLESQGAILPKTSKGALKVDKKTLEQWQHLPSVPLLLEYSKIEKLKSTYTEALLKKQKEGLIHCSFNQLSKDVKGNTFGISTGRLSSSNPNLQNIPVRTEEGKLLREAFIAGNNKVFIDADFSQIEPRLVAHFSQDPLFIRAFKENRDIYQDLVEGTGRDRNDGKTFMLALLYGAQPKKLASIFKCNEQEASEIINSIMKKLPGVRAWIERTKFSAKKKGGVYTLFKRWIPLPNINSLDRYEKMHWERVAVNSVIQGSAAEIMKLALIKLKEHGYSTVLTVHDEYLIEDDGVNLEENENHASVIKYIMESIVTLDVPLKASIGIGKTWSEAKV